MVHCVRVAPTKENRSLAATATNKKTRNRMDNTKSRPLSVADCCEMMRILQHPDVKGCFVNTNGQTALASLDHRPIHTVLREEKSVQQLLTNTELIQRISAMHIKMREHEHS